MRDQCMIRHKLSSAIITSLITFASGFSAAQENLCEDHEEVIWSCSSAIKVYSLCGSEHVKDEPGYLKYRAGTTKETEFVYPDSSQAPRDVFKYRLLNTTAVVEFENGGYRYLIYESINGEATIEVDKDGKTVANIECDSSTDTLTLTPTIKQFKAMGIYQ